MSRIVVTGGAGFIGSHVTEALVVQGHEVIVVDDLSTGNRRNVPSEAEWVQLDLRDPGLTAVFARYKPEAVYHFAAQASVVKSVHQPLQDAEINILGTVNLLEACKSAGVRKCVYSSSAAVYGMPESGLLSETHGVRPLSFYGISKYVPELYLETYRRLYGIDYTVLRYANAYGARQNADGEGGVVSIFAARMLAGQTPVIYGSGNQTRDFIYVEDIVRANLAAWEKAGGKVLNVGTDSSVSVNDLLREMCRLLAVPFEPRYEPARPGDIPDSRLDNREAARVLEWEPVYTLRDGLRETLRYYREEQETKGKLA